MSTSGSRERANRPQTVPPSTFMDRVRTHMPLPNQIPLLGRLGRRLMLGFADDSLSSTGGPGNASENVGFNQAVEASVVEALSDPNVLAEMSIRIKGMLTNIGVLEEEASQTATALVSELSNNGGSYPAIDQVGERWFEEFERRGYTPKIDIDLMGRNRWVASLVSPHLQPGSVLDHDSGNSYVADFVQQHRPDTQVQTDDSFDFRTDIQHLPFAMYDYGTKQLPFADGRFDNAMVITVLHHTDEPERMFDEILRTVRPGGTVLLFENTFKEGDRTEKRLNVAFDWFFNAILHRTGLPLPFSHRSVEAWDRFLKDRGLEVLQTVDCGHHTSIPIDHTLYIARKPS